MAKVTLDMETFKALASETRLQVLRALDERRKTLSELAREMELNKATVHEHLQLLTGTGLIKKRDDEGRKWIYYELTWRGQRLLHPEETTSFAVLLGLSIAAAGGGVAVLGRALGWWWQERQTMSPDEPEFAPFSDAADTQEGNGTSEPSNDGPQQSQPPDESSRELRAEDPGPQSSDDMDFFDEDGILAILLLATSVLLAVLAWGMQRFRRR